MSDSEMRDILREGEEAPFVSPQRLADRAWTKQENCLSDNGDDNNDDSSESGKSCQRSKPYFTFQEPNPFPLDSKAVKVDDEKLPRPYCEYYDRIEGDNERRRRSSVGALNNHARASQKRVRVTVDIHSDDEEDDEVRAYGTRRRPIQPAHPAEGVQCVDSTWMTSTEIHKSLVVVLQKTLSDLHFLEWNNNFCHFDSVLILQLVSYCNLGAAYWEKKDSTTTRAQSHHERELLNLLLTFGKYPADQMKALRNNWMWAALNLDPQAGPMYGEDIDALVHMYPAGCLADEYHSVRIHRKMLFQVVCTNHSLMGSEISGCLKAERETRRVSKGCARLLQVHTLQDAVSNAFKHNTGDGFSCKQSIKGVPHSKCPGVFSVSVVTATVGALLCIDLEPPFTVDLRKQTERELLVGTLCYSLIGMALWNGGHYISRFRVVQAGMDVWYEYDDLKKPRNIKTLKEPFSYANGWLPRALWYTRTSNRSQPMETAV